jgi:hypothetical protein
MVDPTLSSRDLLGMRRGSAFHAAVRSAFSRAAREPIARGPGGTVATRISPYALAFVAGFPGAIGGLALAAAISRAGLSDGAFALGAGLLLLAGCLLVLGLRSVLVVGPDRVTARFFGLRSTSVRFDRLTSATFGMTFPSISYGIALIDRDGRKAIVHANWWQDEAEVMRPILRALVDHDVAMDRTTARVVSQTLRIPRPKPRIIHRGRFRNDRTW